ncbi:MAG TPA: septum formation inhibitor Maf, partial [Candidatus Rokubacteria bacterium]|nr:septum formation inhibitor Maf [Candidatus Rokubacteria bacterium]
HCTVAAFGAYVASGARLDKAGAYAIQDLDGRLVDGLVGSYTNVVGLPVEATRRLLVGFGLPLSAPGEA